jgi:hypothetical protein
MSSTSTSRLGLFKPVPGSGEPFRTSDLNSNSDKIDAEAVAVDGRLDVVELAVGASGSVVNATNAVSATTAGSATSATSATTATNLAGGAQARIPVQSAAGATVFVAASGAVGQVLQSTPVPPYVGWATPPVFKMASGIIAAGSFTDGVSSAVDLTSYGFTVAPVVVVSPVYAGMNALYVTSVSSTPSTSSFVVRQRLLTSGSNTVAAPATAVAVHWVAVQQVAA